MAFADPQSVTINGAATSLPRVGTTQPVRIGKFSNADASVTLEVRQDQTAQRFRREARLTQKKVAVDPIAATNKEVSTSVFIAVDEPKWGFSDTEIKYLISALTAWFVSGKQDQLLGGEL